MSEPISGLEQAGSPHHDKGSNVLLIGIILGVVLGALFGGFWPEKGHAVDFIGEVFLNGLMLMVVPLVVCSMIMGIASLGDVRKLGGIGLKTIVYYTITTGVAVLIGLIAVNIVRPGEGVSRVDEVAGAWRFEDGHIVLEGAELKRTSYKNHRVVVKVPGRPTLRVTPPAEGEALATGTLERETLTYHGHITKGAQLTKTAIPIAGWTLASGEPVVQPPRRGDGLTLEVVQGENVKEKSIGEVVREMFVGRDNPATGEREGGLVPKNLIKAMVDTEVLPIILFALVFGGILTTLGSRGQPVIAFFDGCNEAIMKMVQGLMYFAPVGIFALVAGRLGLAGGFEGFLPELAQLSKYAATVVGALLFHAVVVLPAFLYFLGRRNPLAYARGMSTALTTAFSTSSSSATLPLTLRGAEKNGVSERTASFVCPLGATINMDGTAMYEAVAAMFIAQAYGIELTMGHQVVIFLTATLAAIGAAGIPEAGIVTMAIVLKAVDLPLEGIGLILSIDWLLDRCRTTINVWGDSVGAAVIDNLEGNRPHAGALTAGAAP